MDENSLEEGWDTNRYLLNEGNHDYGNVHYYTGGVDVNDDSSGMGFESDVRNQLYNSNYFGSENECDDQEEIENNSDINGFIQKATC